MSKPVVVGFDKFAGSQEFLVVVLILPYVSQCCVRITDISKPVVVGFDTFEDERW